MLEICETIYSGPYFNPIYGWIEIVTGFVIVVWHRMKAAQMNQSNQEKVRLLESSSDASARLVLLPVYEYILWMFVFGSFFEGVVVLLVRDLSFEEPNALSTSIAYSLAWGQYHLVIEGLTFLLLQHGAGLNAFRRSLRWATFVGVATVGLMFTVFYYAGSLQAWITSAVFDFSLFTLYLLVWCLPERSLHRRPAVRIYAIFWVVIRGCAIGFTALRFLSESFGYCVYVVVTGVGFGLIKPYIVFKVLLQDSYYWRGLFDDNAGSTNLNQPLLGTTFRAESAYSLALSVDGLRQRRVPLLNHAFLVLGEVDAPTWKVIGVGGSCRVYAATYKGTPVAVKMIFCVELTPATIRAFVAEASLLAQLNDKSVVQMLGVCVRPPTLCVVMELCEFGSLFDVLHQTKSATQTRPKLDKHHQKKKEKKILHPYQGKIMAGEVLSKSSQHSARSYKSSTSKPSLDSLMGSEDGDDSALHYRPYGEEEEKEELESAREELVPVKQPSLRSLLTQQQQQQPPPHAIIDISPPQQEPQLRTISQSVCGKRGIELTWKNRLVMAVQCAQAVAYLHSRNPPLLHLDLKPHNFLVARSTEIEIPNTTQNLHRKTGSRFAPTPPLQTQRISQFNVHFQVKVSDLELALSFTGTQSSRALDSKEDDTPVIPPSSSFAVSKERARTISGLNAVAQATGGVPDTFNWVAPELIAGGMPNATLKADIYSLAMVFYEILTLRTPFAEFGVRKQPTNTFIKGLLQQNYRPPLPPEDGQFDLNIALPDLEKYRFSKHIAASERFGDRSQSSNSDRKPSSPVVVNAAQYFEDTPRDAAPDQIKQFIHLIREMWDPDPARRPSAARCVEILLALYHQAQIIDTQYLL